MEKEIEKIKRAVKVLAETIAYSEARSNSANDRVEGQFMRQVEMYIRNINEILD